MKNYALIELKGADAHDFAHRMFSRNFKKLGLNEGALSLFLSAEGKVQSLFWAIKASEGILILVEDNRQEALFQLIERYHFAEKFVATKGSTIHWDWKSATTSGSVLGRLESGVFRAIWRGAEFEFNLSQTLKTDSDGSWELHRIQNLIPEFGKDYDESTLVFDLGFEELCDENKGCYIGQEVVERVRTRGGQGPRRLAVFEWSSQPPMEAVILSSQNEPIGSSTKSLVCQSEKSWLALGFLKRGFDPSNQELHFQNGTAGHWIKF